MKYFVEAKFDNDDFVFNVVETATEQVISTFFFEEDAVDAAHHFEYGGGFDGFTPSFVLRPVDKKFTNINEAFEMVFDEDAA